MKKIKTAREAKNLSREQLAELTGVSCRHIGYIEKGERTPSLKLAKRIAYILGGTVSDFFC